MTATIPGKALELLYEPSDCNVALAAMEVTPEHASYGYDPGGIGDSHLRGCQSLHRTPIHVSRAVAIALREQRLLQGVSQKMLAAEIGTPSSTLSEWEHGYYQMTIQAAEAIATCLGIDLSDVYQATASVAQRREGRVAA